MAIKHEINEDLYQNIVMAIRNISEQKNNNPL